MPGGLSDESPGERRDLLYSGRVQGVGFRYTTCEIAGHYQVKGYVRNLPDGRVQMVAEGEAAELERFVEAVANELGRYIKNTRSRASQATGEFADFEIRR